MADGTEWQLESLAVIIKCRSREKPAFEGLDLLKIYVCFRRIAMLTRREVLIQLKRIGIREPYPR